MKKFIFMAVLSVILSGCGVGTYSVKSGVEDAAYITFTSAEQHAITVAVDGKTYNINTVKKKAYKKDRDIEQTSMNTIKLTPGQHSVSVSLDGNEVYTHRMFLSTGETRVIEL